MINILRFRTVPQKFTSIVIMLSVIFLCVLVSLFIFQHIERYNQQLLTDSFLSQSRIVAAALNINNIRMLTGIESDARTPYYVRLQDQLSFIIEADPKLHYAYVLGKKGDDVVLLVDSRKEKGDVFVNPMQPGVSGLVRSLFERGHGLVERPVSDSRGKWIFALVPIRDEPAGDVVAVLGLGIDASLWKKETSIDQTFAALIALSLFGLISLPLYFIRRQHTMMARTMASEQRFRHISDSSGDWIWETDRNGRYTYSSLGVKKILGYEPHEVVEKKYFYDFCFPEEKERLHRQAVQDLEQDAFFIQEVGRRQHKDGHEVILDIKGFALRNAQGATIGYRGIDRDVTDKRKSEEAIRRERNFVSAVFDIIGALVVVLDREGRIVRFNRTCEWISGYSLDEVKGKYLWDCLLLPEDVERVKERFAQLGKTEHSGQGENYWVSKDGERHLIAWSNTTLAGEYIIGTGIDITEQRAAELKVVESRRALEQAYRDLEANEKLLRTMLADLQKTNKELQETQNQLIQSQKVASIGVAASGIAHEIKNPLSIVMQSMERIGKIFTKNSIDGEKYVQRITNAIGRANRVIDSLLMFSRESELKMSPLNLHEAIESAITLVASGANLNKVNMERCYAAEIPLIDGDNVMLQQVFFDLFTNAIDAMAEGGTITVKTYVEHEGSEDARLVAEVCDTGEGIPEDIRKRVFDPFFTTKEPGIGTGLGLSIVYLILERHGGTIAIENREGTGTTFVMRFPILKK